MSIIKVENLSKKYIIGHNRNAGGAYRYSSLRDTLAHTARGMYQRLRHPLLPNIENTDLEEFWALKEINFEIKQGDRVGIIGRNGAGKSTLLKILSRITEPTTGKITMNGRVASLLEVGTGFHPELTGRENIYLNGAVLGMSRIEIKKKFDEIVDFSGVEKFLDTPVKRYSSGMYVRLAFSVAAHLEPEILLVDEVLAVGDAEFQKKCLGKMEDVSKEGRTIIFVSHNMSAVEKLCNNGIFLCNGKIKTINNINISIQDYLILLSKNIPHSLETIKTRKGTGEIIFSKFKAYNKTSESCIIKSGDDIDFIIHLKKIKDIYGNLHLSLGINDSFGKGIGYLSSDIIEKKIILNNKDIKVKFSIPKFPYGSGKYTITFFSEINNVIADWVIDGASLIVENGNFYNTGRIQDSSQGNFLFMYSIKEIV